jgi:hypothetical protein
MVLDEVDRNEERNEDREAVDPHPGFKSNSPRQVERSVTQSDIDKFQIAMLKSFGAVWVVLDLETVLLGDRQTKKDACVSEIGAVAYFADGRVLRFRRLVQPFDAPLEKTNADRGFQGNTAFALAKVVGLSRENVDNLAWQQRISALFKKVEALYADRSDIWSHSAALTEFSEWLVKMVGDADTDNVFVSAHNGLPHDFPILDELMKDMPGWTKVPVHNHICTVLVSLGVPFFSTVICSARVITPLTISHL